MQIQYAALNEITFEQTNYPDSLKSSLERIGLNFPIRVRKEENGYVCVDGTKRLNAIHDILCEDPTFPKFQKIAILVVDHARTAPPYHLHNHH